MSGQRPERGLFLGKVAFQFTSEGLQFIEVGFDVLRQHIFQPLAHAPVEWRVASSEQVGRWSLVVDSIRFDSKRLEERSLLPTHCTIVLCTCVCAYSII